MIGLIGGSPPAITQSCKSGYCLGTEGHDLSLFEKRVLVVLSPAYGSCNHVNFNQFDVSDIFGPILYYSINSYNTFLPKLAVLVLIIY